MRHLGGLLSLLLLCSGVSACGSGGGPTVVAEFADTAGLFVGNDVGVLGVKVGTVTHIDPEGQYVAVTLQLDDDVKVPANVGAVIVSRSVATDRYVELTPVYTGGKVIESGAVISPAKTRTPLEFDELLKSVDELAGSMAGPDGDASAFSDVLAVVADVLKGNGTRISQTVNDLGVAIESVDGDSGDAAAVLSNLDTLTSALAKNDGTVRAFADNIAAATSMLDDEHLLLQRTFDSLSVMLTEVAAFARDHRAEIGDQLADITAISQTLLRHQDGLIEALETMPLMMQNIERAVDDDARLTFKLRPGDLIPGEVAARALCDELPVDLCDGLDFEALMITDILGLLSGVQK